MMRQIRFKIFDDLKIYAPAELDKELHGIRDDINKLIRFNHDEDPSSMGNRYRLEQVGLMFIQSGDTDAIRQSIDSQQYRLRLNDDYNPYGNYSDNKRETTLLLFASSITLYTRAALNGGLPEEVAYAMSDTYIAHALALKDISLVNQLNIAALYDFAANVQRYQYANLDKTIRRCCEYIRIHLTEKITMSDLAEFCGKSGNYISDLFQKELGERPVSYIRKQKLSYSCTLLLSTDMSIREISGALAFSSASRYNEYFRKEYGMSPKEYKNRGQFMVPGTAPLL